MSAIEEARHLIARALSRPAEMIPVDGTFETIDGWDSIGHVTIIMGIEERLGRRLVPEEVVAVHSVEGVASVLNGRRPPCGISDT